MYCGTELPNIKNEKNNEKEKGGIFYGRFEKEAGEKAEVEQG